MRESTASAAAADDPGLLPCAADLKFRKVGTSDKGDE
jgi:hypothetical protein